MRTAAPTRLTQQQSTPMAISTSACITGRPSWCTALGANWSQPLPFRAKTRAFRRRRMWPSSPAQAKALQPSAVVTADGYSLLTPSPGEPGNRTEDEVSRFDPSAPTPLESIGLSFDDCLRLEVEGADCIRTEDCPDVPLHAGTDVELGPVLPLELQSHPCRQDNLCACVRIDLAWYSSFLLESANVG